jgi:hypothetical protein
MLHNAMSIFTFVGSNLAQHDDVYSFQLITLTINTIIPALITVSNFVLAGKFFTVHESNGNQS